MELLDKDELGLRVLDIAEKLKVSHSNLKRHLDKLLKVELVVLYELVEPSNKKPKIFLISPINMNEVYSDMEITKEHKELLTKREERYRKAIELLRDVRKIDVNKQMLDSLDMDLRKALTRARIISKGKK